MKYIVVFKEEDPILLNVSTIEKIEKSTLTNGVKITFKNDNTINYETTLKDIITQLLFLKIISKPGIEYYIKTALDNDDLM